MNEIYYLDFTNAKEFPEELHGLISFDATHNGIEIYALHEETPIPWDAGVDVEGENLVMDGRFGPSGYGSIRVKLPKKDAKRNYRFEVWIRSGEHWDKAKKILEDIGVVLSKKE